MRLAFLAPTERAIEMANYNYFVSYDLNGEKPTHQEMDIHLKEK